MFNWKRFSLVVSLLAVVLLALQFSNVPKVAAQVKAALVRSIDEPARVPYLVTAAPTCPFLNDCVLTGTMVPAGKRVRITQLEGSLIFQTNQIFFALHLNDVRHPLVMFQAPAVNGFFWGSVASFSQPVDYYFEAGQTPVLEIGCSAVGSIASDSRNTLSLVGYMVDTTP
jgi:hypothetical protein